MASQIDHIILAVDAAERPALSARLRAAGFAHGDAGRHPGGTTNENVAFAGGGFVELLYEQEPGSGPAIWFRETPRVQGIGFCTTDYNSEIRAWGTPAGSWNQVFPKILDNGAKTQCRAAGPLPRELFYLFYMDRPAPPFAKLGATARLTEVTFRGADHSLWRDRIRIWFGLPDRGEILSCADVRFSFVAGGPSPARVSLTFAVRQGQGTIPISGGAIELVLTSQTSDPQPGNGGTP